MRLGSSAFIYHFAPFCNQLCASTRRIASYLGCSVPAIRLHSEIVGKAWRCIPLAAPQVCQAAHPRRIHSVIILHSSLCAKRLQHAVHPCFLQSLRKYLYSMESCMGGNGMVERLLPVPPAYTFDTNTLYKHIKDERTTSGPCSYGACFRSRSPKRNDLQISHHVSRFSATSSNQLNV